MNASDPSPYAALPLLPARDARPVGPEGETRDGGRPGLAAAFNADPPAEGRAEEIRLEDPLMPPAEPQIVV